MIEMKEKRKKSLANKMHRDIFLLVFFATLVPVIIATICLYYLIFNITASEFGIPEIIARTVIPAAKKVTAILLVAAPISIAVILILTYKITHRIIGPYDRIVNELDECLEGKKQGPLSIRKTDKFASLVERINKLLEKVKNQKA